MKIRTPGEGVMRQTIAMRIEEARLVTEALAASDARYGALHSRLSEALADFDLGNEVVMLQVAKGES